MPLRASPLQCWKSLLNFASCMAKLPILLSILCMKIQKCKGSSLNVISSAFCSCIMLIICRRCASWESVQFEVICWSLTYSEGSWHLTPMLAPLCHHTFLSLLYFAFAPRSWALYTSFLPLLSAHASHWAAAGFKGDLATELLTGLLSPSSNIWLILSFA